MPGPRTAAKARAGVEQATSHNANLVAPAVVKKPFRNKPPALVGLSSLVQPPPRVAHAGALHSPAPLRRAEARSCCWTTILAIRHKIMATIPGQQRKTAICAKL